MNNYYYLKCSPSKFKVIKLQIRIVYKDYLFDSSVENIKIFSKRLEVIKYLNFIFIFFIFVVGFFCEKVKYQTIIFDESDSLIRLT